MRPMTLATTTRLRSLAMALPVLVFMLATSAACADERPASEVALTPFGAEQSGNADGSIPPWSGGLPAPAACAVASAEACDPYADEQPLYTVSAANAEAYASLLGDGQRALLAAYPDTYQLRVFPTRRSFANPPEIDAATQANAGRAQLRDGELTRAAGGVPFLRPATGDEVLWNHRLRYRPLLRERELRQWVTSAGGERIASTLVERERFNYALPRSGGRLLSGPLVQRQHWLIAPPALAGTGVLFEDMARPADFARRSWQFARGDTRVRQLPTLGYDTAALGSEKLRDNDQIDTFFGPLDRYRWKLRGKRELLVPANSHALLRAQIEAGTDVLGARHLNPLFARYERRRVWVVEARVAPGMVHRSMQRRFYVDEDGWQIRLVENFDADERLARVQETHSVMAYDRAYEMPVTEVIYDLEGSRYLVQALQKEISGTAVEDSFSPAALAQRGRRLASATRS